MAIPAPELWSQIQKDLSGRSNADQIAILRRHLKDWPAEWKGPYRELQQKLTKLLSKLESTETVKTGSSARDPFHVPREGDAQFVLLGLPNTGKSAVVSTLTAARTPVTDFPFGTQSPIPGSLRHQSASIQIVDTPALVAGTSHGEGAGPRLLNLVREGDALGIVVDLSNNPGDQMQVVISELVQSNVLPIPTPTSTLLRKRGKGGVVFAGAPVSSDEQHVIRQMLGEVGIQHCEIRVIDAFSREELDAQLRGLRVVPTIIIGTKSDLATEAAFVRSSETTRFECVATNFLDETNYDQLRDRILWILGLIRIDLLDRPSAAANRTSVVLKRGTDIAEFAQQLGPGALRSARIWGAQVKHAGQPVSSQYLLQDNDAVFVDR